MDENGIPSFTDFYATVLKQVWDQVRRFWKGQLLVNTAATLLTLVLLQQSQPDAWVAAKAALEANVIILLLSVGFYLVRSPWILDVARAKEAANLSQRLVVEEQRNSRPELKGDLINGFFDLAYQSTSGPTMEAPLILLEMNIWNERRTNNREEGMAKSANDGRHG